MVCFFFFKQKTAYEMRISDWSSDVCSSDLGLADADALALDLLRQQRHRQLQLVLDLHLGDVAVGAGFEGEPDRSHAVGRRLRREVHQAVQALHVLLDDLGHRVLDHLGRCAGIRRADLDGRRRHGGIHRDRQGEDRQRAGEHDDDRDDPREDGPVDEEACHGSLRYSCAAGAGVVVVLAVAAVCAASSSCAAASVAGAGVASGRGAAAFSTTSTLAPGAIFCRPSTTTRSPAARPDSTSHWSPMVWLTTTGRCSTTPSALTTIAVVLPFGSRAMPCIGARIASCRMPASSTARTYMPGIRMWSGLSTRIRRLKLPVLGSTLTSENSSVPLCENSLPS